jgi:hypothetical protein
MSDFWEIREKGIGNGFSVVNPADGYRKDDRLWFGNCSVCEERVTNSFLKGIWEHTLILETDGKGYTKSKTIDYCPKVGG